MIVVDTSVLMAILNDEEEAPLIQYILNESLQNVLCAPTKFELQMVAIARKGEPGQSMVSDMLAGFRIDTLPWTEGMADIATTAFLRFGRGSGHPAKLNFGDCMAYAMAKSLDAPLLFKGNDFSHTDIESAL